MPRIGTGPNQAYADELRQSRRKRKRPARRRSPSPPPPVRHAPSAPPRNADTGDPARTRPAPPLPRKGRAPAFQPVGRQRPPFRAAQDQARRRSQRADSHIGDRRYHPPQPPPPKPFKIDPTQIGRSPIFRPVGSTSRPFRVQQSRARQESRRARAALPDHPAIPEVADGLYLQSDLDKLDRAYKRARLKAARGHVREAESDYRKAVRELERTSPDERIARIREAYKKAARELGGSSITDLYQYGSTRQRRQMKRVGRLVTEYEEAKANEIATNEQSINQYGQFGRPIAEAKPKQATLLGHEVKQASFGAGLGQVLSTAGRFLDERTRIPNKRNASIADLLNVGPQLTQATIEDPGAVAKSSVRTAIESVAGIPQGVKEMFTNPSGAFGAMVDDYEHRYGSIFDNPGEFRRRVKEESGLTPFVLDAASLGVPVGRAASALAASGPTGRALVAMARVADGHGKLRPLADFLHTTRKAARAPRDAAKVRRLREEIRMAVLDGDTATAKRLRRELVNAEATAKATARPALRFSGGEGGVRAQGTSKNLIVALGQRGLDASRRSAHARAVARSGHELEPGGRLVTVRGRKVKRMTALRPGEREVVPKTTGLIGRSARELPGLRRYTGRVARDLGEQQSITRIKLLTHRGRVLNQINRALRTLDDNESAAMKYMLQLGATPDANGVRLLERRRDQIVAARAANRTRIPSVLEDSNDELRLIERILDDPTAHLTPRARAVADELRELQIAEARRDPELTDAQELIRRLTPQGAALGVTRGPDVEFFRDVLRAIEADTVPGVARHADSLASMMPDERGAAATRLRKDVTKQRKKAERRVATADRRLAAARARVAELEKRDVPLTTTEITEARRELARAKRARRAAGRALTRQERRAGETLGRLGERERIGRPLATDEVKAARSTVSKIQKVVNALERRVAAAERRAGRSEGRAEARTKAQLGRRLDRLRKRRDAMRAKPLPGELAPAELPKNPNVPEDIRKLVHEYARRDYSKKPIDFWVPYLSDDRGSVKLKLAIAEHRNGLSDTEYDKFGEGLAEEYRNAWEDDQRRRDAAESVDPIARLAEELRRLEVDAEIRELELERKGGKPDPTAATKAADELQANLKLAREVLRDAQQRLKDVERAAPRLTPTQLLSGLDVEATAATRTGALTDAELRVAGAKARLEGAEAAAPRVPDWMHDRVATRERELAASRASRDHVREFEKALRQVVRASKHKFTMRLEEADEFAARVMKAAEDEGLAAPAYWWSAVRPEDLPSLAAAGRGTRAAHANKPYKGKLFDIGVEEHDVGRYTQGIERNIKRRFQQALVARNLETHAYEWSRGIHGGGLTLKEIKRHMDDRAIDPSSVELIDPRILRRRGTEQEGVERGMELRHEDFDPDEDLISTTQQELAAGRRRWKDVERDELKHQSQHRFLVVPREVGETLDGVANRMDNTFWRGMEIVLKQKPARILLGAANVPWLAFQIASNALLTGFGGGLNPFNVHGAHKWWKGLTPDEREAVEAELGVTHGHHFGMDQPHLGATNSRMVNFWRAYKKSRVGRLGNTINPLNLMFRVDEAQNNFFRRVLFYDKSRKMAYRRMGHSWKGIDRLTTRLMDRVLARPPHQQAHLIARHGRDFEEVAKHVNNFLGDYLRFTPAERFLLQRNIMFYGYLRFSLRFVFYTMPIAHPIMANILGNVGRLGSDEIKKLMGVPDNYTLPTSMLTQTYFGDRKDAENNELRSLPLGRFNPFMNALTQLDGLQQAFGVVSPFYQLVADQAFEESSFTGRDWRIGGRPTPSESDRPRNYFGSAASLLNPLAYDFPGHEGRPRNRIFQEGVLSLAFPYRVAEQTGIPGIVPPLEPNQSDDAMLWRPQPMTYADPEAAKGVKKSRTDYAAEGAGKHLLAALLPVFPKRTAAPAVVARELEREAAIRERNSRKPGQRKKRRRKKRKVTRSYSTGGRSGSRYR